MRHPTLRIGLEPDEIIVDSFAGGGGASMGIEMALGRSPDIAINHDAEAIAMHRENHPGTRHYCEDVWKVDPVRACGGRKVGLMWLSPDCKHFSKAKGGKPVEKKIRGLAWVAARWAEAVKPRVIVLENVEEFATWGPLTEDNMPCPVRKGLTFRRFVGRLRNLGYDVDWQVMRACDYGAPTIRKRLFLIARRDGQPIVWPEPTHGPGLLPYRIAAECIDWSVPCPSIFERAKPLADNTLRRIARGMFRYVINCPEPFIVPIAHYNGSAPAHSIREPLRTITAATKGGEFALVTSTAIPVSVSSGPRASAAQLGEHHDDEGNSGRTRGLAGGSDDRGSWDGRDDREQDDCGPQHSAGVLHHRHAGTTRQGTSATVVSPTLIQMGYGEKEGQQPRVPGIDKPLGTVVAGGGKFAVVSAFLAKHYGDQWAGKKASGADEPLPTITGRGTQLNLVTSHLVKLRGTCKDGQPVDQPAPTITGGGTHIAEVRAFLVKYYGTDQDPRLTEPLHTITSTDRFGLVTVQGHDYVIADIGMRMLMPRELYTAQGFPLTYKIDFAAGKPVTKTAQIRMCGNSVSPPNAAAILRAQFAMVQAERNVA